MNKLLLKFKLILMVFMVVHCSTGKAQQLNFNKLKTSDQSSPIRINGAISTNSIFYMGNGGAGRLPLTWNMNGNVNFNLFNVINLPFSFNLTNAGGGFNYPNLPSHLSVHPTYKMVTAHIGNVDMTFSPYTLNGHLFTGIGLDIEPTEKIKLSAMYGRLQRAVEFDSNNIIVPAAYKRMGYGARIDFRNKKYSIGFITFAAKDIVNSLRFKPDSLQIFPKQNLAVSWLGSYKFTKALVANVEYAISALTGDIRDATAGGKGGNNMLKGFITANNSTAYYKAIKTQLNYTYVKSTIGIGYERIDPGYETLGAYYFNNDLENITVNFSQFLLKEKANIAVRFGFQHDDLNGQKSGMNKRSITSVNMNYSPNRRFYSTFSYSNFQTFMNIKPQFQYINQLTQYQNLDTLNFAQISQNANLNINYLFAKRKNNTHTLNLNFNFLDAADKQGGIIRKGNASDFYNTALAYSFLLDSLNISFTTAFNASYNTIGRNVFLTLGPTISVNGKFLKKKIIAGVSTSYNNSSTLGIQQRKVLNIRCNASYVYMKKHHVNLSMLIQSTNVLMRKKTNDLVGTLGYNFNF